MLRNILTTVINPIIYYVLRVQEEGLVSLTYVCIRCLQIVGKYSGHCNCELLCFVRLLDKAIYTFSPTNSFANNWIGTKSILQFVPKIREKVKYSMTAI